MDYVNMLREALPTPGEFPECYAFSIHKAGSSLMHGMIDSVCAAEKIPGITIPDILFSQGVMENEWNDKKELTGLIKSGILYFGFRHLPNFLINMGETFRNRKAVLLVRDPRDALVSMYYSFAGANPSHRRPKKNMKGYLSIRKVYENMALEEFVIKTASGYLNKLVTYREHLNFDNVLVRRYEKIYFDKRTFLKEIFDHFGISVNAETLNRVSEKYDIRPDVEDPSKHIRKGTPGDHRDKLSPETISKLNDIFRDIAQFYGYDLDA